MTIIGKLICSLRARFGATPVHKMRKPKIPMSLEAAKLKAAGINIKVCTTCGLVKPVKPRKRKGAE